jgi:hypothetical protein
MGLGPLLSLVVQPVDVGLELGLVDTPNAAPADLDRGQLARANERVDLRDADAQVGGDVLEREEAWLDGRLVPATSRAGFRAHAPKIAPCRDELLDLTLFAIV